MAQQYKLRISESPLQTPFPTSISPLPTHSRFAKWSNGLEKPRPPPSAAHGFATIWTTVNFFTLRLRQILTPIPTKNSKKFKNPKMLLSPSPWIFCMIFPLCGQVYPQPTPKRRNSQPHFLRRSPSPSKIPTPPSTTALAVCIFDDFAPCRL